MADVELLGVRAPGEPAVMTEAEAPLAAGQARLETVFSGISAGTELSWVKGTNPFLHASWDGELGVFRADRAATGYPVRRLGYMEVGRVVEGDLPTGALVAAAYGHRTRHALDVAAGAHVVLPPDLDPLLGVLVAHMGPICANGLLHAAAELAGPRADALGAGVAGRRVLVTGAGVVGLLCGLLARHHGAEEVAVADVTPARLAAAAGLGLTPVDEREGEAWTVVKDRWRHGPGDRGADLVLQCRGTAAALAGALRCLRPQGVVVDLAFYAGGADDLRLGEEFHHNGLGLRCAQIGRVPRGMGDRWDRPRLRAETVALVRAHGPALRAHLVSDLVPFADGPAFLEDLAARRRQALLAVLTFATTSS